MGKMMFQQKNIEMKLWENVGHIKWLTNTFGAIYFSIEKVSAGVCYAALALFFSPLTHCLPPAHLCRTLITVNVNMRTTPAKEII